MPTTFKSKPGDPRLGDIFDRESSSGPRFVLIGWAQDIGVARNGGRVGAAGGPASVLRLLPFCGPLINAERGIDLSGASLRIGPIVGEGRDQESAAKELEKVVGEALDGGEIPIVIGGGNDQSAPNGRAFLNKFGGRSGESAAVVNLDAHLDVRPLIDGVTAHSGSPFRELLDHSPKMKFTEFACQGEACSSEHVSFVKERGGDLVWLGKVKDVGVEKAFKKVLESFDDRNVFISFDIDCISSAFCPGVSAPAVRGISAEDAVEAAFEAGKWEGTRMMDISEFNPTIEEARTGRLVCQIIYAFMCGVASRKNR